MQMTHRLTRREFSALLGLGLAWPAVGRSEAAYPSAGFRIRAITAGVNLAGVSDFDPMVEAVGFLRRTRDAFEAQGIEVQTLRLATQPLAQYLPDWTGPAALDALAALDRVAVENEVVLSIGPISMVGHNGGPTEEGFAEFALSLIQRTQNISFSCAVTAADGGIDERAARFAAAVMHAIAAGTPGGEGNFRFAATAHVPPGTPFFPAAWFDTGRTFSIGLESPNLLTRAFRDAAGLTQAKARLTRELDLAMAPIAETAQKVARAAAWQYLGIDASPAPGLDASIGRAIEMLTGAPFGSPATLAGCAAITDVLKSLEVQTCGYSGLMLPVLEDTVLAQRAIEGRYGVSELLLYSTVCGTGLDVVPLPGDTSVDLLAATITDVAALSAKYRKALSVRLFPVPGKKAGEVVHFENPYLTDAVVMAL
jgi:uncharacterized protein (UPF0210 family)